MHIDRDFASKVFDWISTLLIGCLTVWMTYALGGWPEAGTPMLVASIMTGILWICHGMWWYYDQDRPRKIRWAALLLLPLVVYVLVRAWLTKTSWLGMVQAFPWVVIFSIWWVMLHGVRTRKRLWAVMGFVGGSLVLTFIFGMVQFYNQPNWLPLNRDTLPDYVGQASGAFGIPDGLAAIGLLLFPVLLLAAALPRLPGVARFVCGAMAGLALLGVIYSGQLFAWYIWLGLLAPMPFLMAADRKHRIRYSLRIVLLLIASGLFLKIYGDRLWGALDDGWHRPQQSERVIANQLGWKLVAEAPAFGYGPGSLAQNWESVRPAGVNFTPGRLPGGWVHFLYDYGLVGLGLLCGPLLFFIWRMTVKWYEEPWIHLSREQKERFDALEAFHDAEKIVAQRREAKQPVETMGEPQKRRYRRKAIQKASGIMPLNKILFPGLVLGPLGIFIFAGWSGFWQIPALSICLFLMMGFGLKSHGWRDFAISRRHRIRGVGFIVALAVGGSIAVYGYKLYTSVEDAFESHERLVYSLETPQILRSDSGYVDESLVNLESSVTLEPDNPQVLADFLIYRLWEAQNSPHASQIDPTLLISHLSKLETLAPNEARTLMLKAWAFAYLEKPEAEVLQLVEAACAKAPQHAGFQAIGELARRRLGDKGSAQNFFYNVVWPKPSPDPFNGGGRARDLQRYVWHSKKRAH